MNYAERTIAALSTQWGKRGSRIIISARCPTTFGPSSSDAAHIDDAAIVRADGNFKPVAAPASPIDEEAAATIHTPNVAETTVAQNPLAVPACDGPAIIEAGAYTEVDRDGLRGRRQCYRHGKTENDGEASEKGYVHDTLLDALCVTSVRQGKIVKEMERVA